MVETLEKVGAKFSSPEEEVLFLRKRLEEKGAGTAEKSPVAPEKEHSKEVISDYAAQKTSEVLAPGYAMPKEEQEKIILELKPEAHDKQMEELLGVLIEKGIKNSKRGILVMKFLLSLSDGKD